jgi:hypothetical protein
MKGIPFPEQTTVYGKPEGWKDEDCYGLPVAQSVYANSEGKPVPCLISCWEKDGQRIYLSITGTTMPPVSIMTESPFPNNYDKEAALVAHQSIRQQQEEYHRLDLQARIPGLFSAIHEAVGGASACWENIAGAGVFDDREASKVAQKLIDFIAQNIRP